MICPNCKSKKVIAHTDKNLRKHRKLVWQCFKCDNFWETNFAEYNKTGKYRLVANHLKNANIELICPHCNIVLAAKENN